MVRNVILLISTLAVLLLLFAGYTSLVGGWGRPADTSPSPAAALPQTTQVADENKLQIQGVEIEPGEKMAYIAYGPDGRPTDYFRCENWEKVAGTTNELLVTQPELMMRLPSGMIVTVTAERGQISADRVDRKRVQPKFGWLAGNARIVIDRATRFDRTPLSERPEDQITIEMERLDFDLELGELKTAEPLRVTSPQFEITGTGLHLLWNQADNRVEKLLIERGGQMVLSGDLLASLGESLAKDDRDAGLPTTTQPAQRVVSAPTGKSRKGTPYRCEFTGGVSVDHYVGRERAGRLQADELVLVFDMGGEDRSLARREKATPTAPTSQPDERPANQLVVRWNGRLALGPASGPPVPERPRRQFEARGRPVVVDLPNGRVLCSRLILQEETKRLWLYPTEDGLVELSSGDKLSVKAAGVFLDLGSNVAKLVGQVLFESDAGRGSANQSLRIGCNLWAELHLAAGRDKNTAENVFDNPLASRPPESAVFVGDVRVEYGEQVLRAQRFDTRFRRTQGHAEPDALLGAAAAPPRSESAAKAPPMQALLESAVATGEVCLSVVDSSARHDWQGVLEQRAAVLRRALVQAVSKGARGGRRDRARPEDRTLRCASLRLNFAPEGGEVRVREMEASGAVEIYDRDRRFAVRGRRVAATFAGREEFQRATVSGTEADPALVRARAYTLRGKEIDVDNQARTLRVDGRSRLAFRSRRSLQGLTRRRAETIAVTSNQSMRVDEPGNTVHFIGEVVASTGNEELLADALTLLLEDAGAEREQTTRSWAQDAMRLMRGKLFGEPQLTHTPRPILAATASRSDDRKELAGVLARNAEIRSVVYAPGNPEPLVYQSVSGPELEIDIRRRMIRTVGETVLGLTDRRLRDDADSTRVEPGFPSALMTRGPSQTVMWCQRGLTYVLGEEGPQRRDSVLLEGGVVFRHVTGRDMAQLEQWMPELVSDPDFSKTHKIKNRNIELRCGRLEGAFVAADKSGGRRARLDLRPSLQVSLLNARDNVYVRDQQDAVVREVFAHQLEFDRASAVLRVLGLPEAGIMATVYDQNLETGRFSMPATGPEIIVNLETNTVRAKQIRGRASR
jgi:hypothetical protein